MRYPGMVRNKEAEKPSVIIGADLFEAAGIPRQQRGTKPSVHSHLDNNN